MRRFALALLMPLLMLLSQQGAAWHEIGHLSSKQGSSQQERKDDPADKLCAVCLSFAHLAATTAPELPKLLLADAAHVQTSAHTFASLNAEALAPRSRGPPVLI
nr:DUF2946 family protein [Pelomonas sp. KK5]